MVELEVVDGGDWWLSTIIMEESSTSDEVDVEGRRL